MLPPSVEAFLRAHVDSLERLEVLLLLHAEPERAFSPEDVHARLGLGVIVAGRVLAELEAQGLARSRAGGGASLSDDAAAVAATQELALVYARRRLEVINSIVARSLDRIRDFADAFRLKKGS